MLSESSTIPQDIPIVVPSPSLPGDATTAEDIIAHADSLSAQMALHSYYMPILDGMHDLLKGDGVQNRSTTTTTAIVPTPAVDFSVGFGMTDPCSGGGLSREDEEIGGDGDYIDHLQQPGNTKKRKVPTNMSGSRHGNHHPDVGSGNSAVDDRAGSAVSLVGNSENNKGIPVAWPNDSDTALDIFALAAVPLSSSIPQVRKGRLSVATLAGLQHKEMLKNRKRQLAVVLGALSHGDTLALDQALSARYPFGIAGGLLSGESVRTRLSNRKGPRLARAAKARRLNNQESGEMETFKFPTRKFTFVCHSATSERLIATREEVAILHSRFEAELARQAAKAAEAAKKAVSSITNSPNVKRAAGIKQGLAKSINGRGGDEPSGPDQSAAGTKRGGKKKKRSALANASNPHHLRNYVPSRLPNSAQTNGTQVNVNTQGYLGPPPLRFLSAQIPPRRKGKGSENVPASTLTNPSDEWICPLCEYKLFFGEETGYTRAVKSRKKILKRRKRAQERAAAAASGKPFMPASDRGEPIFDDGNREAEFEGPYAKDAVPGAAYKPPRWKMNASGGENTASGFDQHSHSFG